ncbi:AAEL017398-PA [Aedes aegypti]|uniref:Odorant receptor n=2 Tax=Aedes aegypti TaxID=7159 RepID=A0A1S7UEC1_AEDAE|nr:AAEL017398-PA [Aedes aegypti]DAA80369.1 TPA_exp: odorant receptor 21 [Aedes aegypti]
MDLIETLSRYYVFRYKINSAVQFYHEMVEKIDKYNAIIGANMFKSKSIVLTFPFALAVCMHCIYVYLFTSSMYYYRDDIEKILINVTTIGFSIQMLAKLYTFLYGRQNMVELHKLNLIYFENNHFGSETVKEALFKNAKFTYVVLQLVVIYLFTLWILITAPFLLYSVISSKRLLPFVFEWSHSENWIAYSVNFVIQAICFFYVVVGTYSTDATFIVYLLTGCGQIDAIGAMLQDLNTMIEDGASEQQITEQITRIVKLHQHLMLYMSDLESKFSGYFLTTLGVLSFIMIVSMCALILINWATGLLLVLIATCQLLFVCSLGTYWQIKCDKLLVDVWSLKWYRLSVRNQKSFLLLLNGAQAPLNLTAIFTPLDMSAYLSIHRTLYSICMLLIQFTE